MAATHQELAAHPYDTTDANRELFHAIADIIETHPHRYAQGSWGVGTEPLMYGGKHHLCGTVACVAGHAVALAGYEPTYPPFWEFVKTADGGNVLTIVAAAYELGLSYDDAAILFNSGWKPRGDLTVPEALRAIGDGTPVTTVTPTDIVESAPSLRAVWDLLTPHTRSVAL